MKKSTLFVAALAFGVTTAFAQDLTSKKGEPILPEAGDYAIGVDATPFIGYFGNMMNGNLSNSPFGWNFTNSGAMITGKMFTSETMAYRGAIRIGFGSAKTGNYVTKNGTVSNPPEMVLDERKSSYNFIGLGGGLEWRRGKGRLQGYWGGMAMISFGGSKTEYTYGNAFDATYTSPVSTDWSDTTSTGMPVRNVSSKSGSTIGFGLRGFVGAEFFILPKLSIGGEFGWGLGFSKMGEGESVTATWDSANNTTKETTTTTAGSSSFGFDTDNAAFGMAPAAILIHFHF